jgi:hypothetical protein
VQCGRHSSARAESVSGATFSCAKPPQIYAHFIIPDTSPIRFEYVFIVFRQEYVGESYRNVSRYEYISAVGSTFVITRAKFVIICTKYEIRLRGGDAPMTITGVAAQFGVAHFLFFRVTSFVSSEKVLNITVGYHTSSVLAGHSPECCNFDIYVLPKAGTQFPAGYLMR